MTDPVTIMEFKCGQHTVQMRLNENGAYGISVTHGGLKICNAPIDDQTYEVAEVVDKYLAIHCFNHTVEQYQKEAL